MLIYRLEDKKGNGLYNGCYAYKVGLDRMTDGYDRRAPEVLTRPRSQRPMGYQEMHVCQFGFKSKQQLLDWVPRKYLQRLARLGRHPVAIRIPCEHVLLVKNQCLFVSAYVQTKYRIDV